MNVSFHAQIDYPDEKDPGRCEVRISPVFGTQSEMMGWVSTHRRPGCEVRAYRRDGDRDMPLVAEPDVQPDPARLAQLIAGARKCLDETPAATGKVLR